MQGRIVAKAPQALFLIALVTLVFLAGALIAVAEIFPADHLKAAYRAGRALYSKYTTYSDPLATDLWKPVKTDERGVTLHDAARSYSGLTLYTSGHAPKAILISMDGQIVHEWEKPYSSVWDETAAVREPVQDRQVVFNKAQVLPNGDLMAIYIGVGDSPYGYGMIKLDKHSNVLWKNLDHFHHDFTISDDGTIYGLTHAYRTRPLEGVEDLEPPFMDDFLTLVSPDDGRTLAKISLAEALNDSDYRRLLWHVPYYSMEDPLHTNALEVLGSDSARRLGAKVPVAEPGQVLLSFRELTNGSIALLSVVKRKIVWATRGSWFSQHDPDILPNGDLLLFDNRGHFGSGGISRVIEVDPGTGEVKWSYVGDAQQPMESLIRGSQQRLPNGNTLITESDGGRLLEVTAQGQIVWQYINPVREQKAGRRLIPVLSWAQRIDPRSLHASFIGADADTMVAEETERL